MPGRVDSGVDGVAEEVVEVVVRVAQLLRAHAPALGVARGRALVQRHALEIGCARAVPAGERLAPAATHEAATHCRLEGGGGLVQWCTAASDEFARRGLDARSCHAPPVEEPHERRAAQPHCVRSEHEVAVLLK